MREHAFIFLLVFFTACMGNYRAHDCAYNYSVSVNGSVDIDKGGIESAISSVLRRAPESPVHIEIIIFGYSSGKEVFSYSGDSPEDVLIDKQAGRLNALIKIRRDRVLVDAVFIRVNGNSEEELTRKLADGIRKALCD
jgi:hypothetical protein